MDKVPVRCNLKIPAKKVLLDRLAIQLTPYSQPTELGYFSFDHNRCWKPDKSSLGRLVIPKMNNTLEPLNIFEGASEWKGKDPTTREEYLDPMLNSAKFNGVNCFDFDFVTWRGVLTRIFSSFYGSLIKGDSWTIIGNVRNQTIFMHEQKAEEIYTSGFHKRAVYGGFKFEKLMIKHESQSCTVNNNIEFGTLLKSKLGKHRILFSAEVDGLDEEGKGYVELKTSRWITSEGGDKGQNIYSQAKIITWWLQSYLANIPKILVGYRNDSGGIKKIEYIEVATIARYSRQNLDWDPQIILTFGEMVLTWIKTMVYENNNRNFKLQYDRKKDSNSLSITFDDTIPNFVDLNNLKV